MGKINRIPAIGRLTPRDTSLVRSQTAIDNWEAAAVNKSSSQRVSATLRKTVHHSVTYLCLRARCTAYGGEERGTWLIASRLRLNLSPGCNGRARAHAGSSGFNKRLLATKLLVVRTGAAQGGSSRMSSSGLHPPEIPGAACSPYRFIIAAFVFVAVGRWVCEFLRSQHPL